MRRWYKIIRATTCTASCVLRMKQSSQYAVHLDLAGKEMNDEPRYFAKPANESQSLKRAYSCPCDRFGALEPSRNGVKGIRQAIIAQPNGILEGTAIASSHEVRKSIARIPQTRNACSGGDECSFWFSHGRDLPTEGIQPGHGLRRNVKGSTA